MSARRRILGRSSRVWRRRARSSSWTSGRCPDFAPLLLPAGAASTSSSRLLRSSVSWYSWWASAAEGWWLKQQCLANSVFEMLLTLALTCVYQGCAQSALPLLLRPAHGRPMLLVRKTNSIFVFLKKQT